MPDSLDRQRCFTLTSYCWLIEKAALSFMLMNSYVGTYLCFINGLAGFELASEPPERCIYRGRMLNFSDAHAVNLAIPHYK